LGKLKLKTQLLKPLSRPYLLHWAVVAEAAVVVPEVVEGEVVALQAVEVVVEQVAVR
jgi:hypothetical protein